VRICKKRKLKSYEPLDLPKLDAVLSELKLQRYNEVFEKHNLSVTSLMEMLATEEEWTAQILGLGVKKGHAVRLRREIRKYELCWRKDAEVQKRFVLGRRALVRTSGYEGYECWHEGRLVEVKRVDNADGESTWELGIQHPLCVSNPAIIKFLLEDEGEKFSLPAEPLELGMAKGARVISCFSDESVSGGWAWYEGDVLEWDGKTARVRYTDGIEWEHPYPLQLEMLDIEKSEEVLSTKIVTDLGNEEASILPLLVIQSPLLASSKGSNQGEIK